MAPPPSSIRESEIFYIDKYLDIEKKYRKYVFDNFNRIREDFSNDEEFNMYLEEIEDLSNLKYITL